MVSLGLSFCAFIFLFLFLLGRKWDILLQIHLRLGHVHWGFINSKEKFPSILITLDQFCEAGCLYPLWAVLYYIKTKAGRLNWTLSLDSG